MQLHEARTAQLSHKRKKRVGRGPGSGHGKTSCRGREGATSRSGWSMKVTYEGGQMPLFRRLPKRGFRNGAFKEVFAVVNIGDLGKLFKGGDVSVAQLREVGLLHSAHRVPVKILGEGELSVALTVTADGFSKSAIEKIEKAGGKAIWAEGAPKKAGPAFVREAKQKKLLEDAEKAVLEAKAAKEKRRSGEAPKAVKAKKPAK